MGRGPAPLQAALRVRSERTPPPQYPGLRPATCCPLTSTQSLFSPLRPQRTSWPFLCLMTLRLTVAGMFTRCPLFELNTLSHFMGLHMTPLGFSES